MTTTNHSALGRVFNRNRKGGVLVSVIATMLIMGVLGVSLITFTSTSTHSYLSANSGSRAYYLAEAGLRYAQQVHCDEGWLHGRERTLTLQGGGQIDIVRVGGTFWVTATVDAGTAKEARARVPMALSQCEDDSTDLSRVTFDEFAIFGDVGIALGNNMVVKGDVAIIDDDVAIKGDIDGNVLAHNVEFTAHGIVTGGIYASGEVDIKVGDVEGDIHAQGSINLRSTNATVFEGWIFSTEGPIALQGKSEVRGHVHACDGDVYLGGSAIIGTASEPVEIRASGDIELGGSVKVYGNVYAGGSVVMGSGTIYGDVYAGGSISSGAISGLSLPNSPTFVKEAVCPDLSSLDGLSLPEPAEFTTGGASLSLQTDRSYYLSPGSYGDLSSPNNTQGRTHLYLEAGATDHGNYYFDSVSLGNSMTIYFDLSGTYDIRIFVEEGILIGSDIDIFVSTDGSNYQLMSDATVDQSLAARIYWETHADFSLGSTSWFGTVYTPHGYLGVGNKSYLVGQFYSGGGHSFQGSTIVHVPANYFAEE